MDSHSHRILVVEDDASLRRALQRMLTAGGYRAECYGRAEDLEAVQAATCLVLDVQLPGISGPAFYARLSPPRPPAIFITAYDSPLIRQAIASAGGAMVLPKPFSGNVLLQTVAALLVESRPGAS